MSASKNKSSAAAGKIKLIFDYDGTLHDCIRIYAPAFRRAYAWLVSNGHAPLQNFTDEWIGHWLGWGAKEMWAAFMPDLPKTIKTQASRMLGYNMLLQIHSGQAQLYSGAIDTLQKLHDAGYTLIFLSNCRHDYMTAHSEAFGLDKYFSGFYCTQDYDFAPKTEVFEHIAKRFGDPDRPISEQFVAIGDRFHDMELASTHGLRSIGCLYGFGKPSELDKATACINDVSEIPSVLSSWEM